MPHPRLSIIPAPACALMLAAMGLLTARAEANAVSQKKSEALEVRPLVITK